MDFLTKKLEPIFCKRCGSRLVPDNRIVGYDEQTGAPLQPYLHTKVCPNQNEHNMWDSI